MFLLFPLIKLRNAGSKLIGKRYKKTNWEPDIPGSLSELSQFCRENMKYKADPIRGLLDHIQPVKHMNWQLEKNEKIQGDCDDLATYIGYMLKRMGYKRVYRVNIVRYKHVICAFRDDNAYRYFSNRSYYPGPFKSRYAAVSNWAERNKHKPTRGYYTERL